MKLDLKSKFFYTFWWHHLGKQDVIVTNLYEWKIVVVLMLMCDCVCVCVCVWVGSL